MSNVQKKYHLAFLTSDLKLVQSFLQDENSKLTDSVCQARGHSEDYVSKVFKVDYIQKHILNKSGLKKSRVYMSSGNLKDQTHDIMTLLITVKKKWNQWIFPAHQKIVYTCKVYWGTIHFTNVLSTILGIRGCLINKNHSCSSSPSAVLQTGKEDFYSNRSVW